MTREAVLNGADVIAINDELLARVVDTLVREADPLQIYLFGSRARGDARPDSDMDLLIVEPGPFDETRSRREELGRLWRALGGIPVSKDLLLYTPEEVEHCRGGRNHVIARALREGRLLYERS